MTATLVEDDFELVQAQRRVFAPDCYLPPSAAPRPGVCRFALKGASRAAALMERAADSVARDGIGCTSQL